MEIRYSTGSKNPESMTSQLLLLVAISPRATTALHVAGVERAEAAVAGGLGDAPAGGVVAVRRARS